MEISDWIYWLGIMFIGGTVIILFREGDRMKSAYLGIGWVLMAIFGMLVGVQTIWS